MVYWFIGLVVFVALLAITKRKGYKQIATYRKKMLVIKRFQAGHAENAGAGAPSTVLRW